MEHNVRHDSVSGSRLRGSRGRCEQLLPGLAVQLDVQTTLLPEPREQTGNRRRAFRCYSASGPRGRGRQQVAARVAEDDGTAGALSDPWLEGIFSQAGKPVFCGEFGFAAWYGGRRGFGAYPVYAENDAESGKLYTQYVQSAARSPMLSGWWMRPAGPSGTSWSVSDRRICRRRGSV